MLNGYFLEIYIKKKSKQANKQEKKKKYNIRMRMKTSILPFNDCRLHRFFFARTNGMFSLKNYFVDTF